MLKKDHRRRPSPKALFPPTNKIKYLKKQTTTLTPFPKIIFFKIQKHPLQNLEP